MQAESVACPYCGSHEAAHWADEIGFSVVRCACCALLYVNPRPSRADVTSAVKTGSHSLHGGRLNVQARRVHGKVRKYVRDLQALFADRLEAGPLTWVDVGAGYGEVVEAVQQIAPAGSVVRGVEPMAHKAAAAADLGLPVRHGFLRPQDGPADVVSLVDVLSHLPDPAELLSDMRAALKPGGEIFIETGNAADLQRRAEFAGELGVPDHLLFAGEQHVIGWLDRAGFDVVAIRRRRYDTPVDALKNVAKKLLGRPTRIALPYSSNYRQLQIRARLR